MSMREAWQDVFKGARHYQFWTVFGLNDVKAKYRRSKLGQWWITLSVAIFIVVIGGLYGSIFNTEGTNYLAYMAFGYISWLFIQDSVNLGCQILVQSKPFMLQKGWPVSTFIYRLIYREVMVVAHHAILFPPILLWLGYWPGFAHIIFALLGFVLTVITAFWVVMIISIVSLRYRDFPPIAQSLMRMAFFATPIIWIHRDMGAFGDWIVLLNPFGYFIKIIRDPLIGEGVPTQAWSISIGLSFATALLALFVLSITKKRITYWL